MLNFARYWRMTPAQVESLEPWLRDEMTAYAVRQQREEDRQARRASRRHG